MNRIIYFLVGCISIVAPSYSQNFHVELVKDINPGSENSLPYKMLQFGNKIIFKAIVDSIDSEPWITDGTTQGTVLLKNINTRQTSDGDNASFIEDFVKLGNKVVFSADDEVISRELWITDGTNAGTQVVKDILTGYNNGSNPSRMIMHGGLLYFTAYASAYGTQIFTSDGTEQGTTVLSDFIAAEYFSDFTVFNGKLVFAVDGNNGAEIELWCTDGTWAGTYMIKDICSSTADNGSDPDYFTKFEGELYFSARGDDIGIELWKTDGTEAGTVLVKDINQTGGSSNPWGFKEMNGKLFFWANDGVHGNEPWCTNGDTTYMLKDINSIMNSQYDYYGTEFHNYNNRLYFGAYENEDDAMALWSTDGTDTGTYKVYAFDSIPIEEPEGFLNWNGLLVFSAGEYDRQLWISDGTTQGTHKFLPFPNTISFAAVGTEFVLLNNEVFFRAKYSNDIGVELYKLSSENLSTPHPTVNFKPTVSPNPFDTYIKFSIENNPNTIVSVSLMDVSGRVLKKEQVDTNVGIFETSDLPSGIYFVQIQNKDLFSTSKMVKVE